METSAIYCGLVLEKVDKGIFATITGTPKVDKTQEELYSWGHCVDSRRLCAKELLDHWINHRDTSGQERTGAAGADQDPDQHSLQTCEQDLPSTGGGTVLKAVLLT